MPFQAITEAPFLRDGVSLSFMAIPQSAADRPVSLEVGAVVNLRLGYCCPSVHEARITAFSTEPKRAVLTSEGKDWALEPGVGDETNAIPGIRSEVWRIR